MKILDSPLTGSSAEITPRVISSVHLNPSWYELRIRTFFLRSIRASAEALAIDSKQTNKDIAILYEKNFHGRIRERIMVNFLFLDTLAQPLPGDANHR
jgi:hypothetical protein